MISTERTNFRLRLCLPFAAAVVLTTLAGAMGAASAQSTTGTFTGFLLERGRYTTIDAPRPGVEVVPVGINNRGQIVGEYIVDDARRAASSETSAAGSRQSTFPGPGGPRPTRSTTAVRSSAPTAKIRRSWTTAPSRAVSCSIGASSSGSMSRAPCGPRPTASTTAARWWASTSTPAACLTATSGRRDGSPRSMPPAPTRRAPSTSTTVARSSASISRDAAIPDQCTAFC